MPKSLISLGANLEQPENMIFLAAERLKNHSAVDLIHLSPVYKTTPVGGPGGQKMFLNAAVLIETTLPASALLTVLQQLEADLGRTREVHWGPRTIDLDLLLYDDLVCDFPNLVLPHPRMTFRRFVLQPSCDVAADMVHPTTGSHLWQLLDYLNTSQNYIAVTGGTDVERAALVKKVQNELFGHGIEVELLLKRDQETEDACAEEYRHAKTYLASEWNQDPAQPSESNRWLMSDFWIKPDSFQEEKEQDQLQPKLLISLVSTPTTMDESTSANQKTVFFPGPFLQLNSLNCSPMRAVEEVTAAILATSLRPVPSGDFSTQMRNQ